MSKIDGRLLANRVGTDGVQLLFTPNRGAGNMRPLVATSRAEAEGDLVEVFEFTPAKAQAFLQQVTSQGVADTTIAIEQSKLPALVVER